MIEFTRIASLVSVNEQDQARFQQITQAFMDGVLPVGDMVDLYLEFFPRPEEWRDFE